jgi:beta-glucosidase/6-phospho-beta-glucosidase/beta-galactosidase
VAKTFGDLVDIYATLNEPMVTSGNGYLCKQTHGIAYEQIKKWDRISCSSYGPSFVGLVHNPQYYEPFNKKSEVDIKAAQYVEYLRNEWFLNMAIRGDYDLNLNMIIDKEEKHPELVKGCDFLGVNYYSRNRLKGKAKMSRNSKRRRIEVHT